MTQPLLTIGMFAHAVGLSTSALRYYDECGLLRPAEVDDATGYRYYTPDLSRRAELVARMRAVGMPIDTMRVVLDGSAADATAALRTFLRDHEERSTRTATVVEDLLSTVRTGNADARSADRRIHVPGPVLAAAMRQVSVAADADPDSPLHAVLLDATAHTLDVVATNRYWMTIRTLTLTSTDDPADGPAGDARAAVDRTVVARLADRLDQVEDAVVDLSDEQVQLADQSFAGRSEPYPAHRMLLAGLDEPVTRAVLPRADVEAAIAAAGHADLTVSLTKEGVSIGPVPAGGAGQIRGAVVGPPMTLRLGSALLQRAVAATVGPHVVWAFVGSGRPVRLSSGSQPGFVALLMPMADR